MVRNLDHFIWYEKFRPTSFDDMSLPDIIRKPLTEYIKQGNFPHLLFCGPPGSGKTTAQKILTKSIPCSVKELNASSRDRGVDVIKNKVTTFAESRAKNRTINVVVLEEAHQLTADAQPALLNTMEKYSRNCRFILTTNYPEELLPALRSRCKEYKFKQFSKQQLTTLIGRILQAERIKTKKSYVVALIDKWYPDCRSIINELQGVCYNGKFNLSQFIQTNITPTALIDLVISGNIHNLRTALANETEYVWAYRALFDVLLSTYGTDEEKADMVIIIAEHLNADTNCANKEINFISCVVQILQTINIPILF